MNKYNMNVPDNVRTLQNVQQNGLKSVRIWQYFYLPYIQKHLKAKAKIKEARKEQMLKEKMKKEQEKEKEKALKAQKKEEKKRKLEETTKIKKGIIIIILTNVYIRNVG